MVLSPAVRSQTHLSFSGQLNHRFPEVKFGVSAAHFVVGKLQLNDRIHVNSE